MDKCFIATNESEFVKDHERFKELRKQQGDFTIEFLESHGIESKQFYVGGDGMINCPFGEYSKSNIRLSIIPTESDMVKFEKILSKPWREGLCYFKKNSSITKEFAQKCVDEKIPVNVHRPRLGDYFESLQIWGCRWEMFPIDDVYYIRVESDRLKENDIPKGFKEIKNSEYYQSRERLEEKAV